MSLAMGLTNEELAKTVYSCWCSWLAVQWTVHLVSKHRTTKGQWVYCCSPREIGLLCQALLYPLSTLPWVTRVAEQPLFASTAVGVGGFFGGGSWEGWLFMGMCCFHHPLHEEKSFLDLWKGIQVFCFSFFSAKEGMRNWVSDSLQCVGLRCLSLLQIAWQRAYLHGYGSKCWAMEHFFFFFCEKHTSVSSQCLMVPVWQAEEIRLCFNLARTSKNKFFRVQGKK